MSQDNKEKVEKTKSQMVKISLVSLLIVLLFIIEMYEIINDPANLIVIGTLGAFLLVAVYVEMLFIGKLIEKKVQDQEEAFDNVYRSEKASYLLMRKYFDQMEQKMENFGDLSNIPYKELIAAQKALAKAQINRNKQNTNALLISNDRMMQRLTSIQNDITNILSNTNEIENKGISEINPGLSEQDKAVFLEGNKDVLEKQQEILHNLKELESSLRNEILESANKVASMKSQQISVPQPQMQENEDMIPPLDLDEEFSFGDNQNDQTTEQILENSSESTLDRLLQQMNISDSIEPDTQTIISEPELQPIEAEPELQPLTDEPELQPMIEESELQPIEAEPELQPIAEESELQPIATEPELQPIIEETELQPIIEEPELQSIEAEPELQPIIEESELQPIGIEPELQPLMDDSELPAIEAEPELQPVLESSELIAEPEMELQPMEKEQPNALDVSGDNLFMPERKVSSTLTEADLDAMLPKSEPEYQQVMEQNGLGSFITEPELEPEIVDQPELNTVLNEADHEQEKEQATETLNTSKEITPDRLAAMVANLGTDVQIEPELGPIDEESEVSPVMAETLGSIAQPAVQESSIQSDVSASNDEELEKIMKAMDIDDISEDSLEDLDIDKILEIPLENEKQGSDNSNQVMSSEEIAALIANTDLLSEPASVKDDDVMDLSDPRHVMSSDEIAALIANM